MSVFSIDLFCRVIDNYGDIGVCWRLAQQLSANSHIRLFVDDLAAFTRIAPHVNPLATSQIVSGVQIHAWQHAEQTTPAQIVIEAFACELPNTYQLAMPGYTELWLNLEYLSAEAWVEGLHLLPSPQANGISKYFFFPGFTEKTGGLLRPLANHRKPLDHFFWSKLGLAAPTTDYTAFVFPYPNAPLDTLYQALSQRAESWTVLLAATAPVPTNTYQNLRIQRLPFIDQADFDSLMDFADLNIIRGEDSFVRAIWTEKPFIWQPYIQDDDLHIIKLEAWLAQSGLDASTQELILAWSSNSIDVKQLNFSLENLGAWQQQSHNYAQQLAQQKDLVSQLYSFCSQKLQKAVK